MKRFPVLAVAWLLFGVLAGAAVAFTIYLGSPNDGNPRVVLDLRQPPQPSATQNQAQPVPIPREIREVGGHLVADPALIEASPLGPLPKPAGTRSPRTAYIGPYDAGDTRPKVAIFISGLGISASNTTLALTRLPAPVTLGFPAFGNAAQQWADQARGKGHEIVMEVPMEPFDYPDSDPGPNPLLAGASAEDNVRRLHWSLTRYTGYAGIANLFGGRFLAEQNALAPIMREAARRGLYVFDTGAAQGSVSREQAYREKTHFAMGSIAIDAIQSPEAVDSALGDLESLAREQGWAIGVGQPYPITVDRVADWTGALEGRGLVLVPISALAAIPPEPAPPPAAPASPEPPSPAP